MNNKLSKIITAAAVIIVFILGIIIGKIGFPDKKTEFEDYFVFEDNILENNNFANKYYGSLFYKQLNGGWSQNDVTQFLKNYITEDLKSKGNSSEFSIFADKNTIFYYSVDASTGTDSISILIDMNTSEFPEQEFLTLTIIVHGDDLISDNAQVYYDGTVKFSGSEDLIDYINNIGNGSVFFERGWLDLTSVNTVEETSHLSNIDTVEVYLSQKNDELKRAEKYKSLLQSKYNDIVNEYSEFYDNIEFNTTDALNSIEEYCLYLENEYNANSDFFDNYTVIKYQSNSASDIFMAKKEYKLAKQYADKLQLLYEEL